MGRRIFFRKMTAAILTNLECDAKRIYLQVHRLFVSTFFGWAKKVEKGSYTSVGFLDDVYYKPNSSEAPNGYT